MNELLEIGQKMQLKSGGTLVVQRFLGGGGQGEVYEATIDGRAYALKWYFPHMATAEQRATLEDLVRRGAPTENFLWPLDMVYQPGNPSFGYLMGLREPRFKGIVDMMKRRAEPTFHMLFTAGYNLVDNYLHLHSKGLCYRDISFGNVFFDPETGEVRICDNDNVAVTRASQSGVLGTPRFMAPEIVRGEAQPSTESDLFSLSVLLFYMFMMHHPLEGRREHDIRCFDLPAMKKLYGDEALFIWDPQDEANRPVTGYQDNAIIYWQIYPKFLKDLFTKAFTDGLRDPKNGRVRESEWRKAFIRLRDSIVYCPQCGAEVFYEAERLQQGAAHICWSCNHAVPLPPRIRIEQSVVMLNHDTKLYPHHLGDTNNFAQPVLEVVRNPQDPSVWGLKNLTTDRWQSTRADGVTVDVEPGRSVTLSLGTKIHFGKAEGEIRV